ncbi:hypothetical protein [Anatilimnocola floriformis]|uniref:hypothetical protein n=1 Tax=Anatilimnocola floriformis TaxID=2948575 RepID=UPI0020C4C423|nr:hypothetical protein [Anatilimnocola floriformis]
MDSKEINQPADSLEKSLQQFTPRANLDRDRLMFLAGRESERPSQSSTRAAWLWPASTFAMTGLAACFAIALGLQLAQPPRERIVVREIHVPQPAAETTAATPPVPVIAQAKSNNASPFPSSFPASGLLQMRNMALRFGVDAIPSEHATSTSAGQPLSPIEPWQQLRESPQNPDSSL